MVISVYVQNFKLIVTLLALLGKFKFCDFGRFCMGKSVHELAVCTRWPKRLSNLLYNSLVVPPNGKSRP